MAGGRVRRVKALLAVAVVLTIAAGAYLVVGLDGRIDALEARSAIGEMTVVSREVRLGESQVVQACVRYRAFDGIAEVCRLAAGPAGSQCYQDARVGEPLPESCR